MFFDDFFLWVVWEAKRLACEDSFCAMVIDDTELARTHYFWSNDSPNIYSEYNLFAL